MDIINTQNLSKFYGKHMGIQNVTLTVKKGEVFGFIGPNGAGKSTAIRTLLGLLQPTDGSATMLGEDAFGPQRHELRRRIGYLPSEVEYYDEMSARELLEYHARFYDVADADKRIESLAAQFELDLDRQITDLSFGNKKKCGICQALLHEPELLILDEPTSGLDPLMQNRFFDLLEKLNKEQGVTIFFSSHILSEIQRMCDRAAIIREGEITAIEDIASLLSKQMKKARLVFKEGEALPALPDGASNAHEHGTKLTFDYVGPTSDLLKWMASQPLHDATLEEPDLESIFMNYYRR